MIQHHLNKSTSRFSIISRSYLLLQPLTNHNAMHTCSFTAMRVSYVIGLAAALATSTALAQSTSTTAACSTSLKPSYAAPSLAPGYSAKLVATKLKRPRGILFDAQGHLLVVQQNVGISGMELRDGAGGCVDVVRTMDVVPSTHVSAAV